MTAVDAKTVASGQWPVARKERVLFRPLALGHWHITTRSAMKGYLYLILLVSPAIALPAQGGIFTYKPNTARPKPELQVPALLYIVKADPHEAKRAAAAAELGEFDV